jgi:hypothetical protein
MWEEKLAEGPGLGPGRAGRHRIDEILVGRGSLLKRLRGPDARARGVHWENVIEVGERIVVRI